MAREKETGRAQRLVVTGCLGAALRRGAAPRDPRDRRHPRAPGQVDDIVRAVEGEATRLADAEPGPPDLGLRPHRRRASSPRRPGSAYVKISEGCDYTCSFCIIPTLRGTPPQPERRGHRGRGPGAGRPRRARRSCWWRRTRRATASTTACATGSPTCCGGSGAIDGIRWIRIMYAYPATLTDPILDAIASEEKVVKYVDIPLQHASESVLKRMKRPTGKGNLLGMVERIRARVPGVAIRTLVHRRASRARPRPTSRSCWPSWRPASSTTWASSPSRTRRGRRPSTWPTGCPRGSKERRRRRLMALQKRISTRKNRAPGRGAGRGAGRRAPTPDTDLLLRGRTAGQAPEIDGQVMINDGVAEAGHVRDLRGHGGPPVRPGGPNRLGRNGSTYQMSRAPICIWRGSPSPARMVPSKLKIRLVVWGARRFVALNRLKTSTIGSRRHGLAELELPRQAQVQRRVGVVLAARVALARPSRRRGCGRRGRPKAACDDLAVGRQRQRLGRAVGVAHVHVDLARGLPEEEPVQAVALVAVGVAVLGREVVDVAT